MSGFLKNLLGKKRRNPIQEKMEKAAIDILSDGRLEGRIDDLRAQLPRLNERIHYKINDDGVYETVDVVYYKRDEEGNFVLNEKGEKIEDYVKATPIELTVEEKIDELERRAAILDGILNIASFPHNSPITKSQYAKLVRAWNKLKARLDWICESDRETIIDYKEKFKDEPQFMRIKQESIIRQLISQAPVDFLAYGRMIVGISYGEVSPEYAVMFFSQPSGGGAYIQPRGNQPLISFGNPNQETGSS